MDFDVKNPVGLAQNLLTEGLRGLVSIMASITRFGMDFRKETENFSGSRRSSRTDGSSPPVERRGTSSRNMRASFESASTFERPSLSARQRAQFWPPAPERSGVRPSHAMGDVPVASPGSGPRRRASDPGPAPENKHVADLKKMGSYDNEASDIAPKIYADALNIRLNVQNITPGGVTQDSFGPVAGPDVPEVNIVNTLVADGAGKLSPHWNPKNSGKVYPSGDCLPASILSELKLPVDNQHIQTFRNIAGEHLNDDLHSENSEYKNILS